VFKLYKQTPNIGNYIMDLMMDNLRLQAISKICKAYKPSISLDFVINELGFDSTEEGENFLEKAGCLIINSSGDPKELPERLINTKDTVINAAGVFTQDKLLL
jgi:hypothetical protein